MADDFENQIAPDELDYQAELQRDRSRQAAAAVPAEGAAEKTGPNLNIVELTLVLFLALGVDFGIGWMGGKLAAGSSALSIIPIIGAAASAGLIAVIMALVKFAAFSTAMILGLWCLLRLKTFPAKRFGASTLIEIIPFIGELAPGWTAFVLSIIIKEKIMPMLQKYGAPAEKIASAIPLPQAQAAAKAIKAARTVGETAGKA
jgi:hypothetical protein